jgi:hypothetical protein
MVYHNLFLHEFVQVIGSQVSTSKQHEIRGEPAVNFVQSAIRRQKEWETTALVCLFSFVCLATEAQSGYHI